MKTSCIRLAAVALLVIVALLATAEHGAGGAARAMRAAAPASAHAGLARYRIDADTQGVIEKVDNIYNTSIVSNDGNVFKAEYEAEVGRLGAALERGETEADVA